MSKTASQGRRIFSRIASALVIAGCLALPSMVVAQAAKPVSADAWQGVVAAANKEGKVLLYNAATQAIQTRIKAAFTKAYPGITLEWIRYGSGELMTRLDQERQAGVEGADVGVSTEVAWFDKASKAGYLKAPVGPAMAAWPGAYLLNGVSPVLAMEPIIIMVNTNLVKTPVTGQKDLLRPEFKGKVGIEELASTFVYAWYDQVEKTEEPGYLAKLATNQPRIYPSTPALAQSIASGEIAIANFVNMGAAVATVKQGAPARIVMPTPTFSNQYNGGIMAHSKRPNAAMVLMDFLMSKEGQEAWSGDGASASALPGVPNALDARNVRPVDIVPYTPERNREFKVRFDGLFRR